MEPDPRYNPIKSVYNYEKKNTVRPHDHHIEKVVLGAILLEEESLALVIDVLHENFFDNNRHKSIFRAIVNLFTAAKPIDLLTVTQELRAMGELDGVKIQYLAELPSSVNSSANIEFHTFILREFAIRRKLIELGHKSLEKAQDHKNDILVLLDEVEKELFEVADMNIVKRVERLNVVHSKVMEEIKKLKEQGMGIIGIPSGFKELDDITLGWQKGQLIIIAARPGMGKTAFALSLICHASIEKDMPVVFFSLEMTEEQLMFRLISKEAEIPGIKIRSGKINNTDLENISLKTKSLQEAPIYVDDTAGLSILELRAKCRRLKFQKKIKMIVVDYLQLLHANIKNNMTREQEIANISRSLKQIAKELDVPVIAISQLSRNVELRGGNKKPQLSDLRESGAIEQDADMVLFLYRPAYYGITENEMGESIETLVEVNVAKNRHGSTGETIFLEFIGQYTQFQPWQQTMESSMNHLKKMEETGKEDENNEVF